MGNNRFQYPILLEIVLNENCSGWLAAWPDQGLAVHVLFISLGSLYMNV